MQDTLPVERVQYFADDSHEAHAWVLRGADPLAPVIVGLPTLGREAREYLLLARRFRRSGLNVVLADLRGFGLSRLRATRERDFGFAQVLNGDLPALISTVSRLFPQSPKLLFGHGLGGQLWPLYASVHPHAAAAAVISVGAGAGHYREWPAPQRYGGLAQALGCGRSVASSDLYRRAGGGFHGTWRAR